MKESTQFRFCWSVIKNCIYINKSVKLFTCKGNYIKSLKFNWKQNLLERHILECRLSLDSNLFSILTKHDLRRNYELEEKK